MLLTKAVNDACEFHAAQFEKHYKVKSRFLLGYTLPETPPSHSKTAI